jgi:hypothetical protein
LSNWCRSRNCSNEPTPSILRFSISSIAKHKEPPLKGANVFEPIPDILGQRLAANSYMSVNALLADVSAVCRTVKATVCAMPRTYDGSTGWENAKTLMARVGYFDCHAEDLVIRRRKRLGPKLDLMKEVDHEPSNGYV